MSIHVALTHKTTYRYDRLVTVSPQVVRLRPAPHSRTKILSYSLTVKPTGHFINWQQDPQGNFLARLVFPQTMTELSFEVDLIAEMAVFNPFDFFLEPSAEEFRSTTIPSWERSSNRFSSPNRRGHGCAAFLADVDRRPRRSIDFLVDLNRALQQSVGYVIRIEPGVQSCEETLGKRTGSCRDSAWLLVQALRHLGLAARFVSGYLIELVPDQTPLDGPAGPEPDFTDLHAWAEVYLPGAGWIGLDPTSGLLAGEGHIPLAATPEAGQRRTHHRRRRRLQGRLRPSDGGHPDRRNATGHQTLFRLPMAGDRRARPRRSTNDLEAGDVRLTMGGEPTFVSIDDMEGEEWNTAATGPTKRQRAYDSDQPLARAIRPGRAADLRTRQMVSRRAAAALGLRLLLAGRRQTAVERYRL